jgi:hypothetical protein
MKKGWHQKQHKRTSVKNKQFTAGRLTKAVVKKLKARDLEQLTEDKFDKAYDMSLRMNSRVYDKLFKAKEKRKELQKSKDIQELKERKKLGLKPVLKSKYTKRMLKAIRKGYSEINDFLQLKMPFNEFKNSVWSMANSEPDPYDRGEMEMATLYVKAMYDTTSIAQKYKIINEEQSDDIEGALEGMHYYDE